MTERVTMRERFAENKSDWWVEEYRRRGYEAEAVRCVGGEMYAIQITGANRDDAKRLRLDYRYRNESQAKMHAGKLRAKGWNAEPYQYDMLSMGGMEFLGPFWGVAIDGVLREVPST